MKIQKPFYFITFIAVMTAGLTLSAAALTKEKERGGSVDPLPKGPYAAASSCLLLDSGKLAASPTNLPSGLAGRGGVLADGSEWYLDRLVTNAPEVIRVRVTLPEWDLLDSYAGKSYDTYSVLLYPTLTNNSAADYKLEATSFPLPKMLLPGQKPLFFDPKAKYPLIVFSHGYHSEPLVNLAYYKYLVSRGYAVLAIFHGDDRFPGRDHYFAAVANRVLAVKATLDFLEKSPVYGRNLDMTRVAGGGASLGFLTMTVLAGAEFMGRTDLADKRFKAIFGHYGYLGSSIHSFWGTNATGLSKVRIPVMLEGGTTDTVSPFALHRRFLTRFGGDAWFLTLTNQAHGLSPKAMVDVQTWNSIFFDAVFYDSTDSKTVLEKIARVAGNADDALEYKTEITE